MNRENLSKVFKFKIENTSFTVTIDESFSPASGMLLRDNYRWLHYHAVREMFFAGESEMEIYTENEVLKYKNCAVTIPPFLKHYSVINGAYRILLSCENTGDGKSEFSRFISKLFTCETIYEYKTESDVRLFAKEILKIFENDDDISNDIIISILKTIIYSIFRSNTDCADEHSAKSSDSYLVKIDAILANFQDDISLRRVSEKLGLSTRQTSRIIKKHYKISLSELVLSQRLNYAKMLLVSSDLPVSQIIEKVHFPSSSYFYSQFKKRFGTTPLKYKKMNS